MPFMLSGGVFIALVLFVLANSIRVLREYERAVVFRLVGEDRVERVRIRTGVYRDGFVEAAEGLAAGDRVVVRGQTALIDGSVVSLRHEDGSPATLPSLAPRPRRTCCFPFRDPSHRPTTCQLVSPDSRTRIILVMPTRRFEQEM